MAKFVKQTGGRGQYGDAVLTVKPMTPSEAEDLGLEMKDGVAFRGLHLSEVDSQGVHPKCGVRRSRMRRRVLGGYPMVNVFVDLVFGSYHDVDSSQVAFEQAGRLAFKLACEEAGIGLLEPIMKVTITTPEDFFGTVSGDISSRRGQIVDSELRGIVRIITAVRCPFRNVRVHLNPSWPHPGPSLQFDGAAQCSHASSMIG